MVLHLWIIECLDLFGVAENINSLLVNSMEKWKVMLCSGNSVSWKPEPEAFAVDTYSINWGHHFKYIFPPFSLLTKVIRKIRQDQVIEILVSPACSTQPWYPQALEVSGEVPLKIRPNLTNLILPKNKAAVHLLAEKLTLHIIKFNLMVD